MPQVGFPKHRDLCVPPPRSSLSSCRSPSRAAGLREPPHRQTWCGSVAEHSGWDAKAAECLTRCRRTADRTPVTNAEFERFVNTTVYVTVAERQLDPKDFPGVPRDKLVPGPPCFMRRRTPSRSTTRCSGGSTRQARAGGIRKDPAAAFRTAWIIRSCTSRSRTHWLMRSRRTSVCPRKRSSSSRHAGASIEISIHGAMS